MLGPCDAKVNTVMSTAKYKDFRKRVEWSKKESKEIWSTSNFSNENVSIYRGVVQPAGLQQLYDNHQALQDHITNCLGDIDGARNAEMAKQSAAEASAHCDAALRVSQKCEQAADTAAELTAAAGPVLDALKALDAKMDANLTRLTRIETRLAAVENKCCMIS